MEQSLAVKEQLNTLEKLMIKEPQVNCPVIHRFGPGVYIREVFLPADTIAIGHRQKEFHTNIFLKGRVIILNENGFIEELIAPMTFVGPPGRKCGLILEDVVWLNIYSTDEKDVEILEETYLDKSPIHSDDLRYVSREIDIQDYHKVLEEYGFDETTARSQSENEEDQIDFPWGGYAVQVSNSVIEGKGLFATANLIAGEPIAPARIDGKRTPAGRYTNHSACPNAQMYGQQKDIVLIAIKDIEGCKGGLLGEEITVDYRRSLDLQV